MKTKRIALEDLPPRKPGITLAYAIIHSRVNGGPYYGDLLKPWAWTWPKDTWLRQTLRKIREGE